MFPRWIIGMRGLCDVEIMTVHTRVCLNGLTFYYSPKKHAVFGHWII